MGHPIWVPGTTPNSHCPSHPHVYAYVLDGMEHIVESMHYRCPSRPHLLYWTRWDIHELCPTRTLIPLRNVHPIPLYLETGK